ncbi:MAG: histidine phosphatase family protein [Cyanobacteria bacterium P01_E01_bin.42]
MVKSCKVFLALGLGAIAIAGSQIPPFGGGSENLALANERNRVSFAKNETAFNDIVSGTALVNALRGGGHVIFFRHVQTEKDYADQADVNLNVNDCSTQRSLSEAGWQDARTIGAAFERLNIPVGKVYSSQYCRAWQTADLAFGQYEKVPGLNFAPAEEYTDVQIAQMRAGIEPLLMAVPTPGTNTVVIGHDDVFESATGIYPEPQGIAFIIKPNGLGEFVILASLTPEEWALLK